ncbi:hypothetical protein [Kribbella pratensis]|nr:hypothetical protein [Kribbella pratensis]
MTNAPDASEAARLVARARWGTTKLDRLIGELHDRADELGEQQRADLRSLLDDNDEGDRR